MPTFLSRLVRPLTYLLLLSILSSTVPLLPARPAFAAPVPSRAALPLTNTPPARPVAAQTTGLRADAATIADLRQRYGSRQTALTAPAFDGTFSAPRAQTYAALDAVTLNGSGTLSTTVTVPAGVIRDSLQLDLSLTTYGYYSASAGIAVRPHGTSAWLGTTSLIEVRGDIVNGTPQTGTLSQFQISLGKTIPLTTALDIQLYCDKGLGSYSCTWSNLRFFQDVPSWEPPQLSTLYGPAALMASLTARVTDTAFDGIAPCRIGDHFSR